MSQDRNRRYVNQAVVVTGAANGIGRTYAEGFAREGARVIGVDINSEALAKTVSDITAAGGRAEALTLDVSAETAGQTIAEALGGQPLKALVNNAAFLIGDVHGFEDVSRAQWLRFLDVNTLSPLFLGNALRPLLKTGSGSIVNQVSTAAYVASTAYAVTKVALIAMTQAMARKFAPDGIRVNAVAPGLIDTKAVHDYLGDEIMKDMRDQQMVARQGLPEDLANLVLFLCSDEASFIDGQVMLCDGGKTMQL